jgi:hypothetical protein
MRALLRIMIIIIITIILIIVIIIIIIVIIMIMITSVLGVIIVAVTIGAEIIGGEKYIVPVDPVNPTVPHLISRKVCPFDPILIFPLVVRKMFDVFISLL